jgi:hypothetical protein
VFPCCCGSFGAKVKTSLIGRRTTWRAAEKKTNVR